MPTISRRMALSHKYTDDRSYDTGKSLREIVLTMSALTYAITYDKDKNDLLKSSLVKTNELIPMFIKGDVNNTVSNFKIRLINSADNTTTIGRNVSFLKSGDKLKASFSNVYGSLNFNSDIFKSLETRSREYGDYYTNYRKRPRRKPTVCSWTSDARSPFNYLVDPQILGVGRGDAISTVSEALSVMLGGYEVTDFKNNLSDTTTYDKTIITSNNIFEEMASMMNHTSSNSIPVSGITNSIRHNIKELFESLAKLNIDTISSEVQSSLNIVCGRKTPFPLGRKNKEWKLNKSIAGTYYNDIVRNCSNDRRNPSFISSSSAAMNVSMEIEGRTTSSYYTTRCEKAMRFSMLFPYLKVIRPEDFLSSPFTAAINLTLSVELDDKMVRMMYNLEEINKHLVKLFSSAVDAVHKQQVDEAVRNEVYKNIPYTSDTPIYSTVKKEVEELRRKIEVDEKRIKANRKSLEEARDRSGTMIRIPSPFIEPSYRNNTKKDPCVDTPSCLSVSDCDDDCWDDCVGTSEFDLDEPSGYDYCSSSSCTSDDIMIKSVREPTFSGKYALNHSGKTWRRDSRGTFCPEVQNLLYTKRYCERSDILYLKHIKFKKPEEYFRENIEINGAKLYLTSEMIGYSINYLTVAVEYFYLPVLKLYNFLTETDILEDYSEIRESLEFPIRFLMYQLNLELFHHISKDNIEETIKLKKELNKIKESLTTNELYSKYCDKDTLDTMVSKIDGVMVLEPSFISSSEGVEEYKVTHDADAPPYLKEKLGAFKVSVAMMERKICLNGLTLDGKPIKDIENIEES